jgi:hypothetical protein
MGKTTSETKKAKSGKTDKAESGTSSKNSSPSSPTKADKKKTDKKKTDKKKDQTSDDDDESGHESGSDSEEDTGEADTISESDVTAANQVTSLARLSLNVIKLRKRMLAWFDNLGKQKPMLRHYPHVYVTSVIEQLSVYIMKRSMKETKTDQMGVFNISERAIGQAVNNTPMLRQYYSYATDRYDAEHDYRSESIILPDELDKILESLNAKYLIKPKALNLLCYLINYFFNDVMRMSCGLQRYKTNNVLNASTMSISMELALREKFAQIFDEAALDCVKRVEDAPKPKKAKKPASGDKTTSSKKK